MSKGWKSDKVNTHLGKSRNGFLDLPVKDDKARKSGRKELGQHKGRAAPYI
jgi:hypothetical protein